MGFDEFDQMSRSAKHSAGVELKSIAKSSKLLVYSAKLAMDDRGDKASSKVLNELYTDPCGNSAEVLLSNSNQKPGSNSSFCVLFGSYWLPLIHFPFRFDSNEFSRGTQHDSYLGIN